MKNFWIAGTLLIFASSVAQAHLETGTYTGKLAETENEPCGFIISAIDFEGGVKHPLNERVMLETANYGKFILRHLPQVNLSTSEVRAEKDQLTDANFTADGVNAVVLRMDPQKHELKDFTMVLERANPVRKWKEVCVDLVHGQ